MALAAGTYAVLSTTEGKITVRLFEAEAPITVKNFIELAEGAKEWTHPTSRANPAPSSTTAPSSTASFPTS
jgi:peptidyl-prolyl cis-trans isomerase A (cyclophilin A)